MTLQTDGGVLKGKKVNLSRSNGKMNGEDSWPRQITQTVVSDKNSATV